MRKLTDLKRVYKKMILLSVLLISCIIFAGVNAHYLKENPLNRDFTLDYPSAGTLGENGNIYVIDQSKQRVSAFTKEGKYLFQIQGGSRRAKSFYSADDLKADHEGNVYVVDVVLSLDGSAIEKERIIQFDGKGKYRSTVYEIEYEEGNRPLTTGRIQGMALTRDGLWFVYSEKDRLSLKKITADKKAETVKTIPYDTRYLIAFAIDKKDGKIYAVTKMAEILRIEDDGTAQAVYKGEEHNSDDFFSIPWKIVTDQSGYLYFTDIGLRNIGYISPLGLVGIAIGREDQENLSNNRIFYSLDVSPERVITSVLSSDVCMAQLEGDSAGAPVKYGTGEGSIKTEYSGGYIAVRAFVYLSVLLAVLLLALIIYQAAQLKIKITFTEMAKNNFIIISVAVIIASVAVPNIMDNMQKQYRAQVMNNMCSVAELTCNALDPEDVEAINKPQDYTSEAYGRVKEDIRNSFSSSNGWNEGLYCTLNRVDPNKIIYSCLYLEDTIGAVYPLDYEYYGLEYEELYETGKQIRFDWIENTDGIWSYVLSPVFNEDGEVIAAMEVGTNLYAFQEANNAMIRTMIFNVVSIVAIMILIFTELSFIWFYREKAGREAAARVGGNENGASRKLAVYIIRPMVFMIFMADCMATAFLPMLANQMAAPLWGIPVELVGAIPISTEVLLTAIFSFMGGFMLEKIGFRKMMILGSILFTAGLTAVGCSASILAFIGAKAVIGIGVGLLLVSINTLIASYPQEESRDGFSFYNSGSLAGLTVGTTVGSFLAVSLGYLNVYFVAAAISLVLLVMILNIYRKDTVYPELNAEGGEENTGKLGIFQFLFKKELIIFFACAMIPYLFCGYFLNYFLPLFAESQGMTETAIGQLFLINGVCVIYLGPSLTSLLTARLKLKYPVIIAGAIYIATLFLFFLFTGNGMVVASALLFGIADSFGFSALSIYFSSLDAVRVFGSGKAMGVYSTFENISQTLGPFVFSSVFVLGIKNGIFAIAAVYLILLVLYTLFGKKTER